MKRFVHYKMRFFINISMFLSWMDTKYELCLLKHFLNPIYESIENTILVYEAVRKVLQCQMIVDSSKSYLEAIGIYNKNPDNVRILLLCRDGRGVLYSHIKRNFSRNKGLRGWKNHYKRAIPLFEKYVTDNHVLRVKYEHIVQDPTAELKRICRFLNVEFEKDMLNFANNVHHITNGNDMRFSKSSEIRADTAWLHKLSEADRAFFDRKAGDLNLNLGYVRK